MEWQRLEVLADGKSVASFAEKELEALLSRPAAPPLLTEVRRIAPGLKAVAYLWIPFDAPVSRLAHRLAFTLPSAPSQAERIVEGKAVHVLPSAVTFGPPVRGAGWVARFNSNGAFHRRGLFPVDGAATISQRFAIDWNRYDEEGKEVRGDGKRNTDYTVYGQEVIAVADAVVAAASDGMAENVPNAISQTTTGNPDAAAGNHVILGIEHGGRTIYATYAHLQTGSLTIKKGDRVRRGQVLGRVGNSGNATGPHLHFHVSDRPGIRGEGVPWQIDRFTRVGREVEAEWKEKASETHANEYPQEHWIVAF
jgi:murein DD-endopeptidase